MAQDAARAKVQGVWCMVKGLNLWDLRGLSVDNYNVWYIYIYTYNNIYIYIYYTRIYNIIYITNYEYVISIRAITSLCI